MTGIHNKPFSWDGLYNPLYAYRCSTRDPAAVFHDGKFYIFVKHQFEQHRWGSPQTMLFMGARHGDPYERMALGIARSKDLLNWEVIPEEISAGEYMAQCKAHQQMYRENDPQV